MDSIYQALSCRARCTCQKASLRSGRIRGWTRSQQLLQRFAFEIHMTRGIRGLFSPDYCYAAQILTARLKEQLSRRGFRSDRTWTQRWRWSPLHLAEVHTCSGGASSPSLLSLNNPPPLLSLSYMLLISGGIVVDRCVFHSAAQFGAFTGLSAKIVAFEYVATWVRSEM